MDFRTKLIGFAGAAMLFSGIASAQFTCTTIIPTGIGSGILRAEGQTELIPQLNISGCSGPTTATTNATVQVFLTSGAGAVTITSPGSGLTATNQTPQVAAGPGQGQVTPNAANQVVPTGATEAQLQIAGTGTTYFGTASGGTVTFSNVNLSTGVPASLVISNVRINASTVAASSGNPVSISALGYVSVAGASAVATTTNTTSVALVLSGLQPSKIFSNTGQTSGGVTGISNPFGVCGSVNSGGTGSATPNFFVSINENFAVAFKSRYGTGTGLNTVYASGSESSNVGLEAVGSPVTIVNSGTRFQIAFSNIPAGLNLFVPTTVTAPDGAIITGQVSGTAATNGTTNNTVAVTSPSSVNTLGYFQVPVTNGAGTVFYEVTTDNSGLDQFSVPVILNASTNAVTNQSTSVTAAVSFAPQVATITSNASSVPLFILNTPTQNTVIGFTLCQTSLLFPFVTNQAGFETGIAIANTTKDPNNQAKAESGSCTLNYYGTSTTNPTATVAPNNNEGAGVAFGAGETYAFTLTSALAVGTGNPATFQGYVIAVCQFQDAHGFAYITYQFPGTSSDTMGYLALVLNRGNLSTGAETLEN